MTKHTRIYDKFSYHAEDLNCKYCLHYQRKNKSNKTGCGNAVCRYEDIRQDAIANGRIKRKPGYFKCRE